VVLLASAVELGVLQLTLGQNFPLAGLGTTVRGDRLAEVLEQVFHLAPPLALRKFVADTKLWRSTIIAPSCARSVLVL